MKIYLVGGAVRDQLLGLPIKEKDWVVTEATVQDMLKQGFRQVGKDFPVFLHPETQEEYALARIERKIGKGYTGFSFDTAPTVTLEEDLSRRDLTINAIAQTPEGSIIDPFQGQKDLQNKLLRHVSPAFIEDPVRILRVARFAARFGFAVSPETIELMQQMVKNGEIDALVPERVWKELERALLEKHPSLFFKVLADCGALEKLFPEIHLGGPGLIALDKAAKIPSDSHIRFAILCHDLTESDIVNLCQRYRLPTQHRELALLTQRYLNQYQQAKTLSAVELLDFLNHLDVFRRQARFKDFLLACESSSPRSTSLWLYDLLYAVNQINSSNLPPELKGKDIAVEIQKRRLGAIQSYLDESE